VYRKAKTARGHRVMEDREPKVVENTKQAMFIKGTKTSEVVNSAMADLVFYKEYAGCYSI